jgi:hypothetical protein
MRFVFKAEKSDLRQDQIRAFSSAISEKLIHFIVFSSKVFQRLRPAEMITNKKLYYGNILRVSSIQVIEAEQFYS